MKNNRMRDMAHYSDARYIIRCTRTEFREPYFVGIETRENSKILSKKLREDGYKTYITRITLWPKVPKRWDNPLSEEFSQWMGNALMDKPKSII